jgi:hypothetical protein
MSFFKLQGNECCQQPALPLLRRRPLQFRNQADCVKTQHHNGFKKSYFSFTAAQITCRGIDLAIAAVEEPILPESLGNGFSHGPRDLCVLEVASMGFAFAEFYPFGHSHG